MDGELRAPVEQLLADAIAQEYAEHDEARSGTQTELSPDRRQRIEEALGGLLHAESHDVLHAFLRTRVIAHQQETEELLGPGVSFTLDTLKASSLGEEPLGRAFWDIFRVSTVGAARLLIGRS